MKIWKREPTLEDLNRRSENTLLRTLRIEFTELGENYIEAKMPVDPQTHQPFGLLHGGASAALAESLGSVASVLAAEDPKSACLGIELNVSHLRGVKEGFVIGKCTPIRIGKSLHVWEIQIRNGSSEEYQEICRARLTVLIR